MTKGGLIFAHNNRDIDYVYMATVAATLAKHNLKIPVSLVSDESTISWAKQSGSYDKIEKVFDKIILVDRPNTDNMRKLHDGVNSKQVPFVNANRYNAYDLTPYDKTLLFDTDYLILSDRLNSFWDVDTEVLISSGIKDIYDQGRLGYHDKYTSDTGVHLYWATTVMFTKSNYAERFFSLVNLIKENYSFYADLFRFNDKQYRNDISFSLAKHILDGFETTTQMSLPPVFTALDRDILTDITSEGNLVFLVSPMCDGKFVAASLRGLDIHVMNKQSLMRHADRLLELV